MKIPSFLSLRPTEIFRTPTALESSYYFGMILTSGWVFVCVLGGWYLLQLNHVATIGYELEALKTERTTLMRDLETVDIETSIPSTLYSLRRSAQVQAMPAVSDRYRQYKPIRDVSGVAYAQ